MTWNTTVLTCILAHVNNTAVTSGAAADRAAQNKGGQVYANLCKT